MKPTVSPLLQHIAYLAKRRLSDPEAPLTPEGRGMLQHFAGRPLKHSHWLQITARELGLEYNQVSRESKLFEAIVISMSKGAFGIYLSGSFISLMSTRVSFKP